MVVIPLMWTPAAADLDDLVGLAVASVLCSAAGPSKQGCSVVPSKLHLYGMLLVYTFDFQELRHYSALRTGLATLPLTLAATAASTLLGGRFTAKYGPRIGLATGMSLSALGLLVLGTGAGDTAYVVIAAGFVIFLLGMSLSAPAQTLSVMPYAPDEYKNMGSSALNTARQTGGVIGVAGLSALVSGDLVTGTPLAMAVAAIACVTAAMIALHRIPRAAAR